MTLCRALVRMLTGCAGTLGAGSGRPAGAAWTSPPQWRSRDLAKIDSAANAVLQALPYPVSPTAPAATPVFGLTTPTQPSVDRSPGRRPRPGRRVLPAIPGVSAVTCQVVDGP